MTSATLWARRRSPSNRPLTSQSSGVLPPTRSRNSLLCEVKGRFDGERRLAHRVADVIEGYRGFLALKSFDPDVLICLRERGCTRPLGIVTEAEFLDPEWSFLSSARRHALANILHFGETLPDFLSYNVNDLPHEVPTLWRAALDLPVLAWTVRTEDQRRRAAAWADQMIFEDLRP